FSPHRFRCRDGMLNRWLPGLQPARIARMARQALMSVRHIARSETMRIGCPSERVRDNTVPDLKPRLLRQCRVGYCADAHRHTVAFHKRAVIQLHRAHPLLSMESAHGLPENQIGTL